MDKLTVPQQLRVRPGPKHEAFGPFVLIHNGEQGFGMLLEYNGIAYTVWSGSRTLEIDDTYRVEADFDEGTLRFTSDAYWSELILRPIGEEDLGDFGPAATVETVREAAYESLSAGM